MRYETDGAITTVYDNKGRSFLIDTDQVDYVSKYNWYVDERKEYVVSTSHKIKYKRLHKYLLNTDYLIDHINRNPKDNRLENLRLCTVSQNNLNRGVFKGSKSGVKGVVYLKDRKKYRVRGQYEGKRVSLGYFDTLKEAEKVYNDWVAKYFDIPSSKRKFEN